MPLESSELSTLSRLLDEAIDLPASQIESWLLGLRGDDAALVPQLRTLLTERLADTGFLQGGAVIGEADITEAVAGERVGPYVLIREIGAGGMGSVWLAERSDGQLTRAVALKLPRLVWGRGLAERMARERDIAALLEHPHIARLYDAGVDDRGRPYLALEYIDGVPIDAWCRSNHLSPRERLTLFLQVASAVAYAHAHLVVHRDLKPANVLVSADGQAHLLDFGIAKLLDSDTSDSLTQDQGRVLTPHYASPEQIRGAPVTVESDVYSLGVLLYELLTGAGPYPGGVTANALLPAADQREAPPASDKVADKALAKALRGELDAILAKALQMQPGRRYSTVAAFADDVARFLAGERVLAQPDSASYRMRRLLRQHKGAVATTLLISGAIIAGLIGTITQARRAEAERERATAEATQARLERDHALEQQQLQRGTLEFFALLMRDAAGKEPGAIRQQLDRAVVLIRQTRFEVPIIRASLLRQIAARYGEVGDFATSVQLIREAIAAIPGSKEAPPDPGNLVNLHCSMALYLNELSDEHGATTELDIADRLIAAGARISKPSQVSCLVQRADATTALGQYAAGVQIYRQAISELEAAGVRAGEQLRSVRSGLSTALMAAGEYPQAMAIARPLLAESEAAQGRQSLAVLRRSLIVTKLTRLGGDPLSALNMSDADLATASQIFGAHHIPAGYFLERGLILLDLGRYDGALSAFAAGVAASRTEGRPADALRARLGQSEALLRGGHATEAVASLKTLSAESDKMTPPLQVEALRIEAMIDLARGLDAAALDAILKARQLISSSNTVSDPATFAVAMLEIDLLDRQGNGDQGALAAVGRAFDEARRSSLSPDRSSKVGRALLLRARLLSKASRSGDSRHDAANAAAQLLATLGPSNAETLAAQRLAVR